MKKILLPFIVCLLAAMCLLACNNEKAPSVNTLTTSPTDTTQPETVDLVEYLNVVADKTSDFKIIIPKNTSSNSYSYSLVFDLQKKIKSLTGARLSVVDDWVKEGTDTAADFEIVIGDCNRQVVNDSRDSFDENQYGYMVSGNKIFVYGWNESSLSDAIVLLTSNITKNYDRDSKTLKFAKDSIVKKTNTDWRVEIPMFADGKYDGFACSGMDNLLYYYNDTTAEQYNGYVGGLLLAGYEQVYTNQIGENLFGCYKNVQKDTLIYTSYIPAEKTTRLTTAPLNKTNFINDSAQEKITDTKIVQMGLDYENNNSGMCYVIRLEDGRFIIYDGGGSAAQDHTKLYDLLTEMNVRQDGIHIAAWVITHEHWDHYGNWVKFCNTYGKDVTVDYLIANVPDYATAYYANSDPDENGATYTPIIEGQLATLQGKVKGGMKLVTVQTGQNIKIGNCNIEVLYTQSDLYPADMANLNDASLVTRMSFGEGEKTMIFLADIENAGSQIMIKRYGNELKSDYCNFAHHGFWDAPMELYDLIDPTILFWSYDKNQAAYMVDGNVNKDDGRTNYIKYRNWYVLNQLHVETVFYGDTTNEIAP